VTRIREADAADAGSIAALLTLLGYPTDAAKARVRLARLSSNPLACVLVADEGGRAVGLAAAHVLPVIERDHGTYRLTALVVDGSARRRGLGRSLVEHVEAEARKHGCDRIEVTTDTSRPEAQRFYERLGFQDSPQRFLKHLRPTG
jgi:ribosomal protein S18 acetylase RimI-like enzyme